MTASGMRKPRKAKLETRNASPELETRNGKWKLAPARPPGRRNGLSHQCIVGRAGKKCNLGRECAEKSTYAPPYPLQEKSAEVIENKGANLQAWLPRKACKRREFVDGSTFAQCAGADRWGGDCFVQQRCVRKRSGDGSGRGDERNV